MSANVFTYRGGDIRDIELQTCPQVNGVQLYPIQAGDLVGLVQVVTPAPSSGNGLGVPAGTYICAVPAGAKRLSNDGYTTMKPLNGMDGPPEGNVSSGTAFWTTAALFFVAFAGVALKKIGIQAGETVWKLSDSIDPGYISIATSGRFEYEVATTSTAIQPGDLVKIAIASSNAVPQKIDVGGLAGTDAIGYAAPSKNQLGGRLTSMTGGQTPNNLLSSGTGTPTVIIEIRPQLSHAAIGSGS